MQYTTLGRTDIKVSKICLGTMTFGEQNTEAEAFEQLDYALDHGVNFIDTAEMYPVPVNAKTFNRTETFIGNWLKQSGKRDQIILATKVIGRGAWLPHIRNGEGRPNRAQIKEAIKGSLQRLQTDYVDLYQIHWPDRPTNYFGALSYEVVPNEGEWTPIEETLSALHDLVNEGLVRAIGISNESAWGAMRYIAESDQNGWPRVASIQNAYSLLCRHYDVGLAEVSHREDLGLLAYSPLAFGALSGKYLDEQPEGARLTRWGKYFGRYITPRAIEATRAYCELARDNGLTPAQMALAFVNQQPFVTSNIIGATSIDQLRENIASIDITLTPQLLKDIEKLYLHFQSAAP